MIVNGKERAFKLTVGASLAIANICPDGDLERLDEALTGNYAKIINNVVAVILALQKGAEDARALAEPDYTPDYMTADEVLALEPAELKTLERAAISAFKADSKTSIEVDSKKNRRPSGRI